MASAKNGGDAVERVGDSIRYCREDSWAEASMDRAAHLHYQALSTRSFITGFGIPFLKRIYKELIDRKLGFFIFANDGDRTIGFIMACFDTRRLFGLSFSRFFRFAPLLLPRLMLRPRLIMKIIETAFYAGRERSKINAELLVVAVDPAFHSKGIGSTLIRRMERELKKQNVLEYKVTVHAAMKDSNNFYRKAGMRPAASFVLYGVPWNLYTKKIDGHD